jgi:hypothetical protein
VKECRQPCGWGVRRSVSPQGGTIVAQHVSAGDGLASCSESLQGRHKTGHSKNSCRFAPSSAELTTAPFPISTTYAAVAGKLDEDYIACLVTEVRLPHTRPQFSREVAAF